MKLPGGGFLGEAQAQTTSWGASAVPSVFAWRPRGQPVVTLAFQGPAWHVGNVPAKVWASREAQKREVFLDRVEVGVCRESPLRWRMESWVLNDGGVTPPARRLSVL